MGASNIDALERVLPLIEKYGLALFVAVVFGVVLFGVFRALRTGELVPRETLTKVEAERDEAQEQVRELTKIMNQERERFMEPLLGMVNNLKKDSNSEDRGG